MEINIVDYLNVDYDSFKIDLIVWKFDTNEVPYWDLMRV